MTLKTILAVSYIFIFCLRLCGQNKKVLIINREICRAEIDSLTKKLVYHSTDKPPVPEEGITNLYKKISKSLIISSSDFNKYFYNTSKVFIGFVVDSKGRIIGKRILGNGTKSSITEQTFNVISASNWTPGYCNGQAVPVLVLLPIRVCFR